MTTRETFIELLKEARKNNPADAKLAWHITKEDADIIREYCAELGMEYTLDEEPFFGLPVLNTEADKTEIVVVP